MPPSTQKSTHLGYLLLCLGAGLLIWNEYRAAHVTRLLDEAYKHVTSITPNEYIRPELNEHLVHITGPLHIDEPLTDFDYGVSIQAVKLKKHVQIYQWVETKSSTNDRKDEKYDYVMEWKDHLIDSTKFHVQYGHQNPKEIPISLREYTASVVQIGHLVLGDEFKERFTNYEPILIHVNPTRHDVRLHLGYFYHSQESVAKPAVGDVRVQFSYAGKTNEVVSVTAMQKDGVLVPYTTTTGHSVAFLRFGSLNKQEMFLAEQSEAVKSAWTFRIVGIVIVHLASVSLSRFVKKILLNVSFLRGLETGEITSPGNIVISGLLSLFIIAIAAKLCNE